MSGDEHGLLRLYGQPPQSEPVCFELRLVGLDVVDADGSLEEFRQPGMSELLADHLLGGVRQRRHAISGLLELGQGFDDVGVRGRDQDQLQEPAPLVVGDLLPQELRRHSHRRVADLPEVVVAARDVIDQRIVQHEGEPPREGGLVVKRLVDLARHAAQIEHRLIDVEDQDLRPFDRLLHRFSLRVAGSWQRHTERQKECKPAKWKRPRLRLQVELVVADHDSP